MKQIVFILMLCASPGMAQVVPFVVTPTAAASPETLYVVDDFNRASIGSNWTQKVSPGFAIWNDTTIRPATADIDYGMYWNLTSFADSQYSVAVIVVPAGGVGIPWCGVSVRFSPGTDTSYYGLYANIDGEWQIFRVIHNTYTLFGSGDYGSTSSFDSLKIIAKGDSIIGWYNTTRLAGYEYSAGDKLASGRVGVAAYHDSDISTPRLAITSWRGGKYIP